MHTTSCGSTTRASTSIPCSSSTGRTRRRSAPQRWRGRSMGRDGAANATPAAPGGARSWQRARGAGALAPGQAAAAGRAPRAGVKRGLRASVRLERLEVLGALAAIAQLGRSGPQAGGVRALPLIAQQVGDRLAARLLAQVAGVVLAPLLPAAERGVGPVRLRVEEEEPAAVEDQSTRLPPHPHGAQGAPGARPVSSDQGSTRRLTQRSATTKAAAVRIAIHASSAARPGVTVPRVSARHTFTAWVSGRSQANERAHGGRLSSGKKTPEKRNITEMPSVK